MPKLSECRNQALAAMKLCAEHDAVSGFVRSPNRHVPKFEPLICGQRSPDRQHLSAVNLGLLGFGQKPGSVIFQMDRARGGGDDC